MCVVVLALPAWAGSSRSQLGAAQHTELGSCCTAWGTRARGIRSAPEHTKGFSDALLN